MKIGKIRYHIKCLPEPETFGAFGPWPCASGFPIKFYPIIAVQIISGLRTLIRQDGAAVRHYWHSKQTWWRPPQQRPLSPLVL